jgi:hypothetical protein
VAWRASPRLPAGLVALALLGCSPASAPADPAPQAPAPVPEPASLFADDPIPQSRRTDWTVTGVPWGIPARTKVCATFAPGASVAAINSAIASCSEGVVQLGAGTYNVTGINVYASNVTLRGAGADQTVLKGCNAVRVGNGSANASGIAITGGGAKDTRTITVGSTAGLAVGRMIELDRDNEAGLVVSTVGGSRHMRQLNVITGISGNVVTLRNPLLWDYGRATRG